MIYDLAEGWREVEGWRLVEGVFVSLGLAARSDRGGGEGAIYDL